MHFCKKKSQSKITLEINKILRVNIVFKGCTYNTLTEGCQSCLAEYNNQFT